jgi:hypothetical protein
MFSTSGTILFKQEKLGCPNLACQSMGFAVEEYEEMALIAKELLSSKILLTILPDNWKLLLNSTLKESSFLEKEAV